MSDELPVYSVLLDTAADIPLGDLARTLRKAGFVVEQELEAIGVIVGRAEERLLPTIRATPGVASVEADRSVRPRRNGGTC